MAVKYYNGTEFVTPAMKVYDGTQWADVGGGIPIIEVLLGRFENRTLGAYESTTYTKTLTLENDGKVRYDGYLRTGYCDLEVKINGIIVHTYSYPNGFATNSFSVEQEVNAGTVTIDTKFTSRIDSSLSVMGNTDDSDWETSRYNIIGTYV